MSLFNSEKIQSAQKAQLEMLQQISSRVFESVEQLTQLQLKSLRAASGEQFESLQSMLTVTDPKDLASLQTALPQPAAQAERLMEFNREVYELISSTQADIAKIAESQVEATTQQTQELIETLSKNAPAGAEPAVAMFKTALETVGSTYESVQKAAKQASEMAEEGIAAAASAAGKATATATAATEAPKAAAKK
ncbi:MAG: TIGR01841 family phasin [Pseudomonas sp.]|nr:TIGR01841 family phasin [Pseudomonas sp.]